MAYDSAFRTETVITRSDKNIWHRMVLNTMSVRPVSWRQANSSGMYLVAFNALDVLCWSSPSQGDKAVSTDGLWHDIQCPALKR